MHIQGPRSARATQRSAQADASLLELDGEDEATPKDMACMGAHPEMVRILLESGEVLESADPTLVNENGQTTVVLAQDAGHTELAERLRQRSE